MANNITRMPRQQMMRPQQQGVPSQQWWGGMPGWGGGGWNGDDCCPDSGAPPFPCPPPGWPPPGCPPWFSGQNSPPWYPGANAGVSFGTTPPPNPVRGHFWFDGNVLWMFDGAAWTAVGGSAAASGGASVAIGTAPPTAPQPGALWFDGAMLLLWTGTAWIPTEGNATGASPPANPSSGMLWWNGSVLMVWDGVAWVPVSQTKSYIQATAPPSPNAGDTWWNGTQMFIWDGTKWNAIGPGGSLGPVPTTTEVFSLPLPAALSITPSTGVTFTATPFTATPTIDTQAAWSGTPLLQFKPNKPGWYLSQLIGYGGGASTTFSQAIVKNDSGTYTWSTPVQTIVVYDLVAAANSQVQTAVGLSFLNGTTDYIRHWTFASNGNIAALPFPGPTWAIWALP
jgi:hypothetical protein